MRRQACTDTAVSSRRGEVQPLAAVVWWSGTRRDGWVASGTRNRGYRSRVSGLGGCSGARCEGRRDQVG